MTSANSSAGGGAARCMFPGCERPVRERAGEGGGKPPIYCDALNPATGKLAHTPLTAARERARRERQGANGQPAGLVGEAPASASRDRAAGLLEQFRAAGEQLTTTLTSAMEAMASAGDPESVSAELTAARRQVERARLEADERIGAAEATRDQATAEAATARQAAAEAASARDEAITELDALDATLATTRAELEQARTEHAIELERLRGEHIGELDRLHVEAEGQLTRVRAEAAAQVATAETARDQALTEASAARQAATDATSRAEETREELRQGRAEHRDELAALRREHRDELTAERSRADAALDTLRAEHRREIETLQSALTALRTAQPEQSTADPLEPERPAARKR